MKINKKLFKLGKTKKGKKLHIIPINGNKDLALCLTRCTEDTEGKNKKNEICSICEKEYPKVIKSDLFNIFCG